MPQRDTATRSATRILGIYNLANPLRVPRDTLRPLTTVLHMGRFDGHITAAGRLLPQLVYHTYVDLPDRLRVSAFDGGIPIESIKLALATTPRHDGLLLLNVELGEAATAAHITEFIFATWRDRAAIRISDEPLCDWVTARLPGSVAGEPIAFGRNVHQCVFAGGAVARELLRRNAEAEDALPEVVSILFRGTIDGTRGRELGIRRPAVLNNGDTFMLVHGRGVTLAAGWAEPVENAFGVAAAGLVNAAGVLHRVRRRTLDALELNDAVDVSSVSEARSLISRLSNRLSELQLDLSFGIEAYADTILIPEILVESYHTSLRGVAGLHESSANTSQMVGRVASVIEARRAVLDAATNEWLVRRERIFGASIAIGTLLALPPALMLAYFGVNGSEVDSSYSIFDLHKYGLVYAVIWLPFITLVAAVAIVRRRVRLRMPKWHKHS
ncbi:hypothetical protein [Sphaerisporangium sp. NPDC051011]|uniref:hypothetical protein n=1 Tax=Sphaerisporangium sp. NPDC051011 TaxID=3155792 RepID=UPI0033F7A686